MSSTFAVVIVTISVVATSCCYTWVDTEVIKYLQKYGYLKNDGNNTQTSIGDVGVREAISLFQEFYQIAGDGAINNETLRQMRRPRCGLADIPHFARDTGMNPWKKTHLTWNFQFADANTLKTAARAFHLWTLNSSLTFERKILNPDILISYQGGVHMLANQKRAREICMDAFDGVGGTLAHAYYPTSVPNYTSEIHVDTAESWHIRLEQNPPDTIHLLHTLTHEIGHSLGLVHSSREDSIMFAFSPVKTYPVKLSIEDILRVQHWYGIREEEKSQLPPLTTEIITTPSPPPTTTMKKPARIDLCDLQHVDIVLILDHRLFIAYQHYVWPLGIDGRVKRYEEPLSLKDYMSFLPDGNFSLSAAYQRPSGEIVLFVNDTIYMVDYPSFKLSNGWPKKLKDIRLPKNAVINAAVNTNKGRTYVIFNYDNVAEIDECSMTIIRFRTLQAVFPGIPPSLNLAFRYIDGTIYFANDNTFYKFNEFTNTVTSVSKFDLNVLNVECRRDGLLQQLQDIVSRLIRSQ